MGLSRLFDGASVKQVPPPVQDSRHPGDVALGQALRHMRENYDGRPSAETIAREIQAPVTAGYVSQVERGEKRPRLQVLTGLLRALDADDPGEWPDVVRLHAVMMLLDHREVGLERALGNLERLKSTDVTRLLGDQLPIEAELPGLDPALRPPRKARSPAARTPARSANGQAKRRRRTS